MTNDQARQQVKLLKALTDMTFKDMAKEIGISDDTFYNWKCNHFNFGEDKLSRTEEMLSRHPV